MIHAVLFRLVWRGHKSCDLPLCLLGNVVSLLAGKGHNSLLVVSRFCFMALSCLFEGVCFCDYLPRMSDSLWCPFLQCKLSLSLFLILFLFMLLSQACEESGGKFSEVWNSIRRFHSNRLHAAIYFLN